MSKYLVLSGMLLLVLASFVSKTSKIPLIETEIVNDKNLLDQICSLFPNVISDIDGKEQLAITNVQEDLEAIKKIKSEERTFLNTIKAYDCAEDRFNIILKPLTIISMVHSSDDMRDRAFNCVKELKSFSIDNFFNNELYKAFKEYEKNAFKNEILNEEEIYYFKQKMNTFKRLGLNLPNDILIEVNKLKKEIIQLELEFQKNINEDKTFIKVREEDLAGCNKNFIENLEKDSCGFCILKCDRQFVSEISQYCSNEKTRKDFLNTFYNRAYPANKIILKKLIEKRDELSKKLGFISFAEFDLNDQMAQRPEVVNDFFKDLLETISKKTNQEFDDLKKNLPKEIKLENGKIDKWNYNYVKSYYEQKHFNFDPREIAKYFPLEKTIENMFDIYQKFLGLEFKKVQPKDLWEKDVFAIEIYQKTHSKPFAYVFFDLFSRENKYPTACVVKVTPALKSADKNKQRPGVYLLIANLPKPIKTQPTLLTLKNVATLYHEFGHALHGVLGQTEMAGLSGTSVKSDFVEVPSLLFEKWLSDRTILQMISSHYETGHSLPEDLIETIIEIKCLNERDFIQNQIILSLISLSYFDVGNQKDLDKIFQDYQNKYFPFIRHDTSEHFYASWNHLANPRYASKYYCYVWDKIIASDLFAAIKRYGLLNSEIGKKLIETILSHGGSKDPNVLMHDFLGRKPDNKAFLEDIKVERKTCVNL